MTRVKRGIAGHRRHRKVLKLAKGYRGMRSKNYSRAAEAVLHAGQHAYVDRRKKKRDFRRLWIVRISAAVRAHGMTYSQFMAAAKQTGIGLDRKVLAHLAATEPDSFATIVEQVRAGAPA